MGKRISSVLLVLALMVAIVPMPSASAEDTFVFKGKGFGHGIGMSQYGAKGYASQGKTFDYILGKYYTGTTISTAATGGKNIRVLIGENQSSVNIAPQYAYRVINESNGAVIYQSSAGDSFDVTLSSNLYRVTRNGSVIGSYTGPIRFETTAADYNAYLASLISFGGKRYRGNIRVKASGTSLRTINVIDFEIYLRGIAEMPSSWPIEALKAQAVAARTYAYPKINSPVDGDFDVYGDTRSQNYTGYEKEAEATYGRYWADAVAQTFSKVVTYNGSPVSTFYFSSSGGMTENNENVWTSGAPLSYLRGISDADANSTSTYDTEGWSYSISRAQLESALGISGIRRIQVEETGVSPRAKTLKIIKLNGSSELIQGTTFRSRLGSMNIKSTWFTSISSPSFLAPLPTVTKKAKRGDMNGDDKADIPAFYNYGGGTTAAWVFKSTGGSFVPTSFWWSGSGTFDPTKSKFVYGDFDGDGKEDVLAFYNYGGGTTGAWFFKSNGSTFSPRLWWHSGPGNFDLANATILSGDLNGDGYDEAVAFYKYGPTSTGAFVFSYNGYDLTHSMAWFSPYWDATRMTPVIASDGTGKDVIVAFYNYGGAKTVAWMFNPAQKFAASPVWSSTTWEQSQSKPVAADLDGDGKEEILSFYDYGNSVVQGWKFAWNSSGRLDSPARVFRSASWDISKIRLTSGDFDGDNAGEVAAVRDMGSSTTQINLLKLNGSMLSSSVGWASGVGSWNPSQTILVKNGPEPNFRAAAIPFYRIYKLVTLDVGHGGSDPGAMANGLVEKTINLDVASRVKSLLQAQGYQVIMTRTTDTDVNPSFADVDGDGRYTDYDELAARVKIANDAHADIYISVHHNASTSPYDSGVMTLYGPQSGEGLLLASKLAAGIAGTTGFYNRGAIPRGDLYQPTHTLMPGVITEGGFMTSSSDYLLLLTSSGRQSEAQGIVNGINAYYASR